MDGPDSCATSENSDALVNSSMRINRWLWVKEVFIPIVGLVLAVVGLYINHDVNMRQSEEAIIAREQKYLEFFLANFSDPSPNKQAAAFELLKRVNKNVRGDLIYALSSNANLSHEAWRVIASLGIVKLDFGAANNYEVEIYFSKSNRFLANKISDELISCGFAGKILLGEKVPAFWDRYGWPDGNEIRFEPKADAQAVKYLIGFLDAKNPNLHFNKTAVDDKSRPQSIAIHLPPNGPGIQFRR